MWYISLFNLQSQNPRLLFFSIWRINTWKWSHTDVITEQTLDIKVHFGRFQLEVVVQALSCEFVNEAVMNINTVRPAVLCIPCQHTLLSLSPRSLAVEIQSCAFGVQRVGGGVTCTSLEQPTNKTIKLSLYVIWSLETSWKKLRFSCILKRRVDAIFGVAGTLRHSYSSCTTITWQSCCASCFLSWL